MIARFALALTAWTECWIPDAFILALAATLLVLVAGATATPSTLLQVVDAWSRGFWELIPFTLQMALVIITGHVLATSPPIGRLIRTIAVWPRSPRGAVALVTFFALASSWINWGFRLIFSAVLARELARRVEGVDYRAPAAASALGLGSVWAQGLSGSAALQMATPGYFDGYFDASERAARQHVRPRVHRDDVSASRRPLFGVAWRVRALGRVQMDHRGAVRDGRRRTRSRCTSAGSLARTTSARRSPISSSHSGCCRFWGCSGSARAT